MRTLMAALALVAAGGAARAEDGHVRALAAGYKAAFLCSDLFTAGRTEAQAIADDLEGAYPDLQPLVRALPATVDRANRRVAVAFDPALPPRVAAWRPGLGCAQLPIGAAPTLADRLPRLAAAPPPGDPDRLPWPRGDAQAVDPTPPALAAAVARAFDASYGAGTRTTAVLVVRHGRILAERYADGFGPHVPQRTWSVAKSITATLVGRAVALGLVAVNAPARVPEWRQGDPRGAITLAQLMHMNSGLWTAGPGNRTDEVYLGGSAVTDWVTALPLEHAPGTRFHYANADALLAARTVRAALGDGQRALDFPYAELFWKLGMRHTTAETDWQGNYVLSSQVWTTARDLARLGLLYLADGRWGTEQLLPPGWTRLVATPAGAQPPGPGGYGALFWTYGPADGLPAGTSLMNGNRGQYVWVVPGADAVIVRRGFDPMGAAPFDTVRFGRDLLAALPPARG